MPSRGERYGHWYSLQHESSGEFSHRAPFAAIHDSSRNARTGQIKGGHGSYMGLRLRQGVLRN